MSRKLKIQLDLSDIDIKECLKKDISFAINDYPSQKQIKRNSRGIKLHRVIKGNSQKEE
jgi:uncharacterized protein YijF (DUF1287 family)